MLVTIFSVEHASGVFEVERSGFICFSCPGGNALICVSSFVGTSWYDKIDPAAQAAKATPCWMYDDSPQAGGFI